MCCTMCHGRRLNITNTKDAHPGREATVCAILNRVWIHSTEDISQPGKKEAHIICRRRRRRRFSIKTADYATGGMWSSTNNSSKFPNEGATGYPTANHFGSSFNTNIGSYCSTGEKGGVEQWREVITTICLFFATLVSLVFLSLRVETFMHKKGGLRAGGLAIPLLIISITKHFQNRHLEKRIPLKRIATTPIYLLAGLLLNAVVLYCFIPMNIPTLCLLLSFLDN